MLMVLLLLQSHCESSAGLSDECSIALNRLRPILVSGIGRFSPVLVGIGIRRYLFEHRHRYQ